MTLPDRTGLKRLSDPLTLPRFSLFAIVGVFASICILLIVLLGNDLSSATSRVFRQLGLGSPAERTAGEVADLKSSRTTRKNQFSFTEAVRFEGKTEAGAPFWIQTYRAWDCTILRKQTVLLSSPTDANSEFEKRVREAGKSEKVDAAGEEGTKRAVIRFTEDDGTPRVRILWTEESDFYSTDSPSLDHASRLEAWLKSDESRHPPKVEIDPEQLSFDQTASTNGVTNNGQSFLERSYRSSGCVITSLRIEYFESPQAAQNELTSKIKKDAVEIVENGLEEAKGSNRVVAIFAPEPQAIEFEHSAGILWTSNAELHVIKSASLPHALAFEKSTARAAR